jgi:hypothetical protein
VKTERDDAWILTVTGRRVWPLDPRPEDICIEDIAHALALTCRFTGHCRDFYSVAQHSALCADYVRARGGSAALQLAALLHDASEAYLPDVSRPIKGRLWVTTDVHGPGFMTFRDAEGILMSVIAEALALDLDDTTPLSVSLLKQADNALLMAEKRDLMPEGEHEWSIPVAVEWTETIVPQSWQQAKLCFHRRYLRLRAEVQP